MDDTGSRRRTIDAEQYRARQQAVAEALRAVARRGDPHLPWREVPALGAVFADDEDVLRHLAGTWSRALAGRVDGLLDEVMSPVAAVERAAGELARTRPELHAVLTQYADHPVVARAAARDAAAAGAPGAWAHAQHVRARPATRGAKEAPAASPAATDALAPRLGTARGTERTARPIRVLARLGWRLA